WIDQEGGDDEGRTQVYLAADVRSEILIAFAGAAAQQVHDPSGKFACNRNGIPLDISDFSAASDLIGCLLLERYPQDDDDQRINRFCRRWRRAALRIIKCARVWSAIVAVALALRANGWSL